MEDRVFNFSAGPSQMPLEVLQKAQEELVIYPGAGCSVMEMSHRTKSYEEIIYGAESTLRRIMNVPDNYKILFLQGGASLQFSMIPMNLADRNDNVAYVQTGSFATKAKKEADRWCNARFVGSSKSANYTYIPQQLEPFDDCRYLHITGNNTIYGTTYWNIPETGKVDLVADWSSGILGNWIDVDKYGLIYAGAQKNMGPAGVVVTIIRDDLLERNIDSIVPSMLQYKIAADNDSMYNTPPTYGIYMIKLMSQWVESQGGIRELEKINRLKANMLYDIIDQSKVFHNPVAKEDRSIMNVIFTLNSDEQTADFLKLCTDNGLINIKGHRSVGGCRASIYNGMPVEGVEKLVNLMKEFEIK